MRGPDAPLVVHDILADEVAGYRPSARLLIGADQARMGGLWLEIVDGVVVVDRPPGWAAYPRWQRTRGRVFTLPVGRIGRYRANLRATGCACAPRWYYEQWTIHVANTPASAELFLHAHLTRDIDDRVHLHGGHPRRSTKRPAQGPYRPTRGNGRCSAARSEDCWAAST